jgi:hypothetical protein
MSVYRLAGEAAIWKGNMIAEGTMKSAEGPAPAACLRRPFAGYRRDNDGTVIVMVRDAGARCR